MRTRTFALIVVAEAFDVKRDPFAPELTQLVEGLGGGPVAGEIGRESAQFSGLRS